MSTTPTEPPTAGFDQTQAWAGPGGWPTQPPAGPPPRKKHRVRKVILLCLAGFVGFIVLISVVVAATGGGNSGKTAPVAASSTAVSTSAAPTPTSDTDPNGLACQALDAQGYCPGDDPAPTTQAPSAPAMTASQQQAVESAQGYLSDGQGFSYKGLLQQLTSSYGEGFSRADAKFAIKYLHPDWDHQAVESARNYLSDGQGFSRSALLQQLTSSYGEGFTQAQAEYAVNKVMG